MQRYARKIHGRVFGAYIASPSCPFSNCNFTQLLIIGLHHNTLFPAQSKTYSLHVS